MPIEIVYSRKKDGGQQATDANKDIANTQKLPIAA